MARLPHVGGDQGNWGEILNDFLRQSHDAAGKLAADSVGANQIQAASVTPAKLTGLGQANGLAVLDAQAKLDSAFVPTYLTESSLSMKFVQPAGNVYYVDNYGLRGDWTPNTTASTGTGTNDTAALTALISTIPAGATIVFNRFKTYRLDPILVQKQIHFDFDGAEVVTRTMQRLQAGSGAPLIEFRGAVGTARVVNTVARGEVYVGVPSAADLAQFKAGDYVQLSDSTAMTKWDTGVAVKPSKVEVNMVSSVSSDGLMLAIPASLDYATSPRLSKVDAVHHPTIRNVGMVRDDDPGVAFSGDVETDSPPHLFFFEYCVNPLIENVTADGWQLHIVNFNRCSEAKAHSIVGRNPFRPANSGHGYILRFRQCVDSEATGLVGYGTRHVCNQVNSHRSGSRLSKSFYAIGGAPFQTHGLSSTGAFSHDDTVLGGDGNGWSHGNKQFGWDGDFTIVRPTYRGRSGHAILSRSGSTDLRVIAPNMQARAGFVAVVEGATDVFIDTNGGMMQMVNPTGTNPPIMVRPNLLTSDPIVRQVGNVTVAGRAVRSSVPMMFDLAGALRLVDVDPGTVTIVSAGSQEIK